MNLVRLVSAKPMAGDGRREDVERTLRQSWSRQLEARAGENPAQQAMLLQHFRIRGLTILCANLLAHENTRTVKPEKRRQSAITRGGTVEHVLQGEGQCIVVRRNAQQCAYGYGASGSGSDWYLLPINPAIQAHLTRNQQRAIGTMKRPGNLVIHEGENETASALCAGVRRIVQKARASQMRCDRAHVDDEDREKL